MLDLTAIKARRNSIGNRITKYSVGYPLLADIDALLLEVERLTNENKELADAIIEYNDAELYYAHKDEA